MSERSQLILMAEYNQLMKQRIFKAASSLSNELLIEDKGAFFRSIIGTLSHIMVGDILWLKRFANHPTVYSTLLPLNEIKQPESLDAILFNDVTCFVGERSKLDRLIVDWCNELSEDDIDNPLEYIDFKGELHNKRLGDLILHLFLHQVHHRGQATTLLSQENIDFGDTDLPEMVPDEGLGEIITNKQ